MVQSRSQGFKTFPACEIAVPANASHSKCFFFFGGSGRGRQLHIPSNCEPVTSAICSSFSEDCGAGLKLFLREIHAQCV